MVASEQAVWLAPRPDAPFRALTKAVSAAFPGYLPYGGAYDDVVPHLTVGDRPAGGVTELRAAEADVLRCLPIHARISRVWLMTGHAAPGELAHRGRTATGCGLTPPNTQSGRVRMARDPFRTLCPESLDFWHQTTAWPSAPRSTTKGDP